MKSEELLRDFIKFCEKHPEQRFWQALKNWVGSHFVLLADEIELETGMVLDWKDTYYFEGKEK